jgi:hypothetical protein
MKRRMLCMKSSRYLLRRLTDCLAELHIMREVKHWPCSRVTVFEHIEYDFRFVEPRLFPPNGRLEKSVGGFGGSEDAALSKDKRIVAGLV